MIQDEGTIKIGKSKINIIVGPSTNAVATLIFKVKAEKIALVLSDIIKTKANIRGLLKILFKYIIPNKIRFKGSLRAALSFSFIIMIGKHPMYKKSEVSPLVLR